MRRFVIGAVALAMGAAACAGADTIEVGGRRVPAEPAVEPPGGAFPPELRRNIRTLFDDATTLQEGDIPAVGASADLRAAWLLVDLLRFHQGFLADHDLEMALAELTGVTFEGDEVVPWVAYSDLLLRWDVSAPPNYLRFKEQAFVKIGDTQWKPFFDRRSPLDWREVSWGGVRFDGIEALNDPPMVRGRKGRWLPHDDVVFGIELGGEAVAYPRRVLEVHELVNATVGGRRIAVPYCTLCGTATAWFTDDLGAAEPLTFGTSGLLQRSNKLMFDAQRMSLWDQFDGAALTGPWLREDAQLTWIPVTTTTWGAWRESHPRSTIVREDGGVNRTYVADPLGDRDADGPIFPVGHVDPRLAAQTEVFGVTGPDGTAVAFPADRTMKLLEQGRPVTFLSIELRLNAGGLEAIGAEGKVLPGQTAFWFAWSQFNPDTLLWPDDA